MNLQLLKFNYKKIKKLKKTIIQLFLKQNNYKLMIFLKNKNYNRAISK